MLTTLLRVQNERLSRDKAGHVAGTVEIYYTRVPKDMNAVAKMGHALALVVPQFPSGRAFKLKGWSVVPCPFETKQIPCVE